MDDAKALLDRLHARENGLCTTKKGESGRGAVACISQLCKTCCIQMANTARLNNEPHDPCKTHKVDLVHDNLLAAGHPDVLLSALSPPALRADALPIVQSSTSASDTQGTLGATVMSPNCS